MSRVTHTKKRWKVWNYHRFFDDLRVFVGFPDHFLFIVSYPLQPCGEIWENISTKKSHLSVDHAQTTRASCVMCHARCYYFEAKNSWNQFRSDQNSPRYKVDSSTRKISKKWFFIFPRCGSSNRSNGDDEHQQHDVRFEALAIDLPYVCAVWTLLDFQCDYEFRRRVREIKSKFYTIAVMRSISCSTFSPYQKLAFIVLCVERKHASIKVQLVTEVCELFPILLIHFDLCGLFNFSIWVSFMRVELPDNSNLESHSKSEWNEFVISFESLDDSQNLSSIGVPIGA